MGSSSDAVKRWRKKTKKIIIEAFNGGCGICGYCKCSAALDLHHLDPSKKEFGIGYIMGRPASWDKIVKELKKCVMLCNRCHMEVHHGDATMPKSIPRFNKDFEKINRRNFNFYDVCPVCNGPKTHFTITCSKKCGNSRLGKIDWDSHDLKFLLEDLGSFRKVGERVGCSGSSVKKRMVKLGIYVDPPKKCLKCPTEISKSATHCKKCASQITAKPRRKVPTRPSKEELQNLINTMSWVAIGKKYGVSDNAIRKWARSYGIIE